MELQAGKLEDYREDFRGVLFVLSYWTLLLGDSCEEPFDKGDG